MCSIKLGNTGNLTHNSMTEKYYSSLDWSPQPDYITGLVLMIKKITVHQQQKAEEAKGVQVLVRITCLTRPPRPK